MVHMAHRVLANQGNFENIGLLSFIGFQGIVDV